MVKLNDFAEQKEIKIGIATDHGGVELKAKIVGAAFLEGAKFIDVGAYEVDPSDDYPDFAGKLCLAISKGEIDAGVLLCRSGVGMGINANRFHGVRAVVAHTAKVAIASREHNCSNVLVLPADYISEEEIMKIIAAWINTSFTQAERHIRRLDKIETNSYDVISAIRSVDPEVAGNMDKEFIRQQDGIELIASENFTSVAVQAAQGSCLTNKYAEGYPGKRYYNGCEFVDEVEKLAIDRACELYGAEAANVQPHSGSQANMAAYFAIIKPGDTILAMSLDHGGHLTHGHPMNFSGMLYNVISYGVEKDTEVINYDEIAQLAKKHNPKVLIAGASAYPRTLDFPRLREIADSVGAKLFVDMAHIAGLVAAGEHPSPVPYADIVTSTTHKTLRGPRSGLILCKEEYIKAINSKVFPGMQGGPMMHTIAAKAICFKEAMSDDFKAYQKQVVMNAARLAKELERCGFRVVSGGTDNHIVLVDLQPKDLTGKEMATALDLAGITVNKNMIPFDPKSPFVTSGIRVGTPAITTRGLKEEQMANIADWMKQVAENKDDFSLLAKIAEEVADFMIDYPMPTLKI